MRVVFLLPGSALYGGVKVVLLMVRGLRGLGVDAEAISPEPPPLWFPDGSRLCRQVRDFSSAEVGRADIVVATHWTTVAAALEIDDSLAAHLCQCYEPIWEGIREQWAEIEALYRRPTLKLAISPHLVELVAERTGQRVHYVPQAFEPELFRPPVDERPAGSPLRVLVCGAWQEPFKGVEWGLRAMRPLASEGWLQLVRLSLATEAEEAALWPEAERHCHLPPAAVPELVQSVEVYVGLSHEVEGFGLPALEAMACARPCVLTDIGAVRSLDPESEAALRVEVGDAAGLRRALRLLYESPDLRRGLGCAGRKIAEQFSVARTSEALLRIFALALSSPQSASSA